MKKQYLVQVEQQPQALAASQPLASQPFAAPQPSPTPLHLPLNSSLTLQADDIGVAERRVQALEHLCQGGNVQATEAEAIWAAQVLSKYGVKKGLAAGLQRLGTLAGQAGHWTKALRAFERLLELGLQANELSWQAAAHANLGTLKAMASYFAEAAEHHQKEAEAACRLSHTIWEARARAKLSSALRGQGSTARAQGENGSEQYRAAAATQAQQSLQLALQTGDEESGVKAETALILCQGSSNLAVNQGRQTPRVLDTSQSRTRLKLQELVRKSNRVLAEGRPAVALPILSYFKALADLSSQRIFQARTSNNLGVCLFMMKNFGNSTLWLQRGLKHSFAAVDIGGLRRIASNLKLALSANPNSSAGQVISDCDRILMELHSYKGLELSVPCAQSVKTLLQDAVGVPLNAQLHKRAQPGTGAAPPLWAPGYPQGLNDVDARAHVSRPRDGHVRAGSEDQHIPGQARQFQANEAQGGAAARPNVPIAAARVINTGFQPTPGSKQGLLKQRVGLLNTWKDRRVMINNQKMVIFRTDANQQKGAAAPAKGSTDIVMEVDLKGCSVIAHDFSRQPFGLEIKLMTGHRLQCAALNIQERQSWIECINFAAVQRRDTHLPLQEGQRRAEKKLGGVGFRLAQETRGGMVKLDQIFDGSPAQKVPRIRVGHVVVKVGDVTVVEGFLVKSVAQMITGPIGSKVSITFRDPASSSLYTYSLERQ